MIILRRVLRATVSAVLVSLVVSSKLAFAQSLPVGEDHFRVVAAAGDTLGVSALSARLSRQLVAVVEFLDIPAPQNPITVHVYETIEQKALESGYMLPAHYYVTGELHIVLEPGFQGDAEIALTRLLLAQARLKPENRTLETGLGVYLADRWRGQRSGYFAGRLAGQPVVEFAIAAMEQRRDGVSPLVRSALSGAVVGFLVERWGIAGFRERWLAWRPDVTDMTISSQWTNYLATLRRTHPPNPKPTMQPAFHRGFCHAHEGYDIHNGYGSARSDSAIARLARLGANAISVTPFSYMRDPQRPSVLPFSDSASNENDESVVHTSRVARQFGMRVMLKPHLWLGRGNWPGSIEMNNAADWDTWFDHYYRWIIHYALLAETSDIDMLCVGVELVKATVGREDRWLELFRHIRRVYRGQLVYAANWGDEFEKVTFWGALDFIGVDCYYPLSKSSEPTDDELARGTHEVLARLRTVAERYQRPLLLTEAGFTSQVEPWSDPHHRDYSSDVDLQAQERCYRVFCEGLENAAWVNGVYWWKWPSDLSVGGADHNGFTPAGKPAEAVVQKWFRRWAHR